VSSSGNTPNNYLYAGQQYDHDLGLYYNRARYLDVNRGRFWSQDSFEGNFNSPETLHKYLYANGNPVNIIDPSGKFGSFIEKQQVVLLMTVLTALVVLYAAAVLPRVQIPSRPVPRPRSEDTDTKELPEPTPSPSPQLTPRPRQIGPDVAVDPFDEEKHKLKNFLFRGDDNYRIGQSLGFVLDSDEANNADIQFPWEHVRRARTTDTSRYSSFTENLKIAKAFGRPYKVQTIELIGLELAGVIRILTRQQIVNYMKNSSDAKIRKDANNVNQIMLKNEEVLIEGQIPPGFLKPAK